MTPQRTSISIIVSSRSYERASLHERHCAATVGCNHDYISYHNPAAAMGLCRVYNRGVSESPGDICVFMHEDAFFMERGWGQTIVNKFNTDPTLGMLGVAGTQYLSAELPFWPHAGRPFIRGHVIHDLDHGKRFFMTIFSRDTADVEVVAVDGLFFAIRKKLFQTIRFDEETFDGFHFYDLDIGMQVRLSQRISVTWDIVIKHCSEGSFDHHWKKYASRFTAKWSSHLPATCTASTPDCSVATGQKGENFDLAGKLPHDIILE
ncbi:MAG: hypothetical protein JW795_22745 [Chitinivibrionales bacterium]|nr:hypothetical protein [Chitinivibrionales bacterium]